MMPRHPAQQDFLGNKPEGNAKENTMENTVNATDIRYEAAQVMTGAIYQATLDVDEGDEREALQYIHNVAGKILDLDDEDPQAIAGRVRL
jgi:hypothetical protein